MPKKKSKSAKGSRTDSVEDAIDAASVVSLASEGSEAPTNDIEDVDTLQAVLYKVNAACESLTEKRAETRNIALNFLMYTFRMHYLCLDDSWNYLNTFFDGIETVLRKGKVQDRTLAAECLTVFCLQFETHNFSNCFARFWPLLDTVVRDSTTSAQVRSACATALSTIQFLAGYCDFVSPKDLMKSLETVFKGSCLKGDGKAPVLDTSVSILHISALRSWAFLYTLLAPFDADFAGRSLLPVLLSLLQGTNVDMRILAGETAALIYERIRTEVDERFKGPHYTDLVGLLNDLATDGAKSRSKVDRKKQRHSFRELVDSVARSDIPETSINIGSEVLILTSCTEHFHYDLLCCLLKGGMRRHLRQNCLVRDFFGLGLPIIATSINDRRSVRDQRRFANSFASKIRTQKLSSHRDRRAIILNDSD